MIYSGIVDIPIPADFDGVYLNFTSTTFPGSNGATSTSEPVGWNGLNFVFGGVTIYNTPNFQPVRASVSQDSAIVNVAVHSFVGPSSVFGSGSNVSGDSNQHLDAGSGFFVDGEEGYIGFKFSPDGTAGPYYGWMRVKLTSDVGGGNSSGLIREWAYSSTANTPVMVPEPKGMAVASLAALGLFGFVHRLRRQKAITPVSKA